MQSVSSMISLFARILGRRVSLSTPVNVIANRTEGWMRSCLPDIKGLYFPLIELGLIQTQAASTQPRQFSSAFLHYISSTLVLKSPR